MYGQNEQVEVLGTREITRSARFASEGKCSPIFSDLLVKLSNPLSTTRARWSAGHRVNPQQRGSFCGVGLKAYANSAECKHVVPAESSQLGEEPLYRDSSGVTYPQLVVHRSGSPQIYNEWEIRLQIEHPRFDALPIHRKNVAVLTKGNNED